MTTTTAPNRRTKSRLPLQLSSFVAVGAFGFVVDSAVTFVLVKTFGFSPLIARLPAFALATVLNFWLNRFLTFRHSNATLFGAFLRYLLVCGFGFFVNYVSYALALQAVAQVGYKVPPAYLPVFVGWGAICAMFVTFFGYRHFAFRHR